MVRLKKIQSRSKMVTFPVGVKINHANEEQCEISFNMVGALKALTIEFEHRMPVYLYMKDTTVMNNQQRNDIVTLQYNLINGADLLVIRFGTLQDKQNFLQIGFADRVWDSGQSPSDSSTSTVSPPQME